MDQAGIRYTVWAGQPQAHHPAGRGADHAEEGDAADPHLKL
jgi:hypothetical protein